MNLTRSSRGVVLGVLLAISLMAVGTAAAISFSGTAPEAANVNDTVSMEVTVEDPFEEQSDQWTLRGDTELEGATWNIEVYEQGQLVSQNQAQGTLEQALDRSGQSTPDRIEIEVSGGVPTLEEFDYENQSAENYNVVVLSNADTDTQLQSWDAHRFTTQSNNARTAIDDASGVIDDLNSPSDEVQEKRRQAVNAYDDESFGLAVELAEEAQQLAEDELETQQEENEQSGTPVALIGGVAVVVLLVAGGGAYYWKSQQDSGDYKLQ